MSDCKHVHISIAVLAILILAATPAAAQVPVVDTHYAGVTSAKSVAIADTVLGIAVAFDVNGEDFLWVVGNQPQHIGSGAFELSIGKEELVGWDGAQLRVYDLNQQAWTVRVDASGPASQWESLTYFPVRDWIEAHEPVGTVVGQFLGGAPVEANVRGYEKRVVYDFVNPQNGTSDVGVYDFGSGPVVQFVSQREERRPDIDGDTVAYESSWHDGILTYDLGTGASQVVPVPPTCTRGERPVVGGNGAWLAFAAVGCDGDASSRTLWVYSLATQLLHRVAKLAPKGGYDAYGDYLAFAGPELAVFEIDAVRLGGNVQSTQPTCTPQIPHIRYDSNGARLVEMQTIARDEYGIEHVIYNQAGDAIDWRPDGPLPHNRPFGPAGRWDGNDNQITVRAGNDLFAWDFAEERFHWVGGGYGGWVDAGTVHFVNDKYGAFTTWTSTTGQTMPLGTTPYGEVVLGVSNGRIASEVVTPSSVSIRIRDIASGTSITLPDHGASVPIAFEGDYVATEDWVASAGQSIRLTKIGIGGTRHVHAPPSSGCWIGGPRLAGPIGARLFYVESCGGAQVLRVYDERLGADRAVAHLGGSATYAAFENQVAYVDACDKAVRLTLQERL